ncbi:hypothetical protein GCM10007874_36800 [Labrys miyagiensis]|uniref:Uncharacterized protein n=1 Tax=Labrys miyagiensis TaxID=346912 RepID=A0ABQ6CLL7_9HYPH|nr:hypothetical protein GCM10007874_36800 [Labrys miyagiensis]
MKSAAKIRRASRVAAVFQGARVAAAVMDLSPVRVLDVSGWIAGLGPDVTTAVCSKDDPPAREPTGRPAFFSDWIPARDGRAG